MKKSKSIAKMNMLCLSEHDDAVLKGDNATKTTKQNENSIF